MPAMIMNIDGITHYHGWPDQCSLLLFHQKYYAESKITFDIAASRDLPSLPLE